MKNRIFMAAIVAVILMQVTVTKRGNSVQAQKIVNNVYHLNDQNFDKFIKSGIVLVDFWAVWCGPCRMQAPIIDELAQEAGKKALIAKVNVDEAKVTATRYRIKNIPTLMIFKDGVMVSKMVGVQDKQTLLDAINAAQ